MRRVLDDSQIAFRARMSAAVPFDTATASRVPQSSAKARSNACVLGPDVIQFDSMASIAPASSSPSNSSSDSLAFHIGIQEGLLSKRKVLIGLFVVLGASDIHPI